MNAITRGRTIAAAGFLAASTLLGTALAGPAMQNQGRAAMPHEGTPGMQQEARWRAARRHPAPCVEAAGGAAYRYPGRACARGRHLAGGVTQSGARTGRTGDRPV